MTRVGRAASIAISCAWLASACGGPGPTEAASAGADETAATSDGSAEGADAGNDSATSDSGPDSETGADACTPAMPAPAEQAFLRPGDSRDGVTLSACDYHVWWVAAGKGAETTISIDADGPVDVAISYPDDPTFVQTIKSGTLFGPGTIEFDSPRSGEFAVLVRAINPANDPELEFDYDLRVACTNQCQFETTRFPIVLVHGWTGFENIGPITYFYKVREDLESLGYPISTAVLDPYNSVDVRGEQLVEFAGLALKNHRARKINLLGHSQGGIDSRYLASDAGGGYGDRIGALITLATPHYGTPVSDIALGLLPGPTQDALEFILNLLGATQGQQSDAEASLYTLSQTYMQEEFNVLYTDDPRVKYWSWTGETCRNNEGCMDTVDPLLAFSYDIIKSAEGPNDGLVPHSSAIWGEFLGVIPADHIDEVGQIGGFTGPNYDHIEFFRQNARMLREQAF